VGETETVAVDVGVGVPVAGCAATGTAAPTTVSSAPAAQMIWPRRRKLATRRRRSATMEGDYRPAAMAWVEAPMTDTALGLDAGESFDYPGCSRYEIPFHGSFGEVGRRAG
jgi:hypothetical protein